MRLHPPAGPNKQYASPSWPIPQDVTNAGYGVAMAGLPVGWLSPARPPGLATIAWSAEPGSLPEGRPAWATEGDHSVVIGWAGYGEYHVSLGPSPTVRVVGSSVTEEQLALGFLVSVLPLALPLLDLEPLHGAALAVCDKAVLLLGASGTGKSSLAGVLTKRGWSFLADDACALEDEGLLWPGPPLLGSRIGSAGHPVVGAYDGKTLVAPVGHEPFPRPVGAILVLAPEAEARFGIRQVGQREAVILILRHVRAPWLLAARRRTRQLRVASLLSDRPVGVLTYEPERHPVGEVAAAAAEWADANV
jgi:hypothetical protein